MAHVTHHAQSDYECALKGRARQTTPTASEHSSSEDDSENVHHLTTKKVVAPLPVKRKTFMQMIEPRFWSIITLGFMAAGAPIVLACTILVTAVLRLRARSTAVPWNGKVAIVSGGKVRGTHPSDALPATPRFWELYTKLSIAALCARHLCVRV